MKVAVAIIFLSIGALKFVPYEADSITPFVANSPAKYFFYEHPADYKADLTHEGELKPEQRAWQTSNNTYGFSTGLGTVEIIIGLLTMGGLRGRSSPSPIPSSLCHSFSPPPRHGCRLSAMPIMGSPIYLAPDALC